MKITEGNTPFKNRKNGQISIMDVYVDRRKISIYQGSKGLHPECDIMIVYYEDGKSLQGRTPKHIHWAVDLLMKKHFDEQLTNSFIEAVKKEWDNCSELKDNDYLTLKTITEKYEKKINISKYKKLNDYGDYSVDFLLVILVLMMYEEKTNFPDAYLFNDILGLLSKEDADIFSIISLLTHRW